MLLSKFVLAVSDAELTCSCTGALGDVYISIWLDFDTINKLQLEVNAETVRAAILMQGKTETDSHACLCRI